jgi:large subunit ribosomal protein L5
MATVKEQLHTIQEQLKQQRGFENVMQVPRLEKVTINVGLGKSIKDSGFIDSVEASLTHIAGQKPVRTLAKKSISNFKLREGMPIGMKVTLRGDKMYDFLEKLIHITLPRVRDFRGINTKAVDASGNLTIGIKENIAFPEIKADAIERMHGLEVTITTTADNREDGLALFQAIGIPFKK